MTNLERALAYVQKLPPAISGSGGHDATLQVACECVRFGLAEAETWQVMREFNSRCQPEWSDKELAHKIESAQKIARHGERTMNDYRNKPSVKPVTAAELRALSAARQSQKSGHGAQPADRERGDGPEGWRAYAQRWGADTSKAEATRAMESA